MPEDKKRWPVGQCPVCLGWGQMRQYTCCAACSKWRRAFPGQARLPALQPRDPRQPRRALPPLPADRPRRGPRLDTAPGAGTAAPARVPPARSAPAPGIVADTPREPQGQAGPRRPRHRQAGDPASPDAAGAAGLAAPGRSRAGVLFDARRDWSFLNAGELDQLPALTPAASSLVDELTGMPGPAAGPAARATTPPRPCGSWWPGSGPTPRSPRPTSGRWTPAPAPLSGVERRAGPPM